MVYRVWFSNGFFFGGKGGQICKCIVWGWVPIQWFAMVLPVLWVFLVGGVLVVENTMRFFFFFLFWLCYSIKHIYIYIEREREGIDRSERERKIGK